MLNQLNLNIKLMGLFKGSVLALALITAPFAASAQEGSNYGGANDPGTHYGSAPYTDGQNRHAPLNMNSPQDDVSIWCNNVVRELSQSLQLAEMQEVRGNFTSAEQILIQGLEQTDANNYLRKGPMTARAISRAVTLARILQVSVSGRPNGDRSVVEFVAQYYQFIIHTANDLDIPYYIPHFQCHECRQDGDSDGISQFETNFVQFATEEVQIILDTLTVQGGDGEVFPVGSTHAFVNVLIQSIQNANEDLRESPFVAEYACTIKYLSRLADMLQAGGMGNEPDTVDYAYREASQLISQIRPGCGCFNW